MHDAQACAWDSFALCSNDDESHISEIAIQLNRVANQL